MQIKKSHLFSFIVWSLLIFVLASAQTTLWPYFLGATPVPQTWLVVTIYLTLYRPVSISFFLAYYIGLIVSSFTAAPLGVLLCTLAVLVAMISYVRRSFFWPNTRYFVMATFFSTLLFHVLYVSFSNFQDPNPAPALIGTRLLEVTLTTLTAVPIYWLMKFLDHMFFRERNVSVAVGELE